jgi:hypothetical protein
MAAFVDEQYANATPPTSSRVLIARHTPTALWAFVFMICTLLFRRLPRVTNFIAQFSLV